MASGCCPAALESPLAWAAPRQRCQSPHEAIPEWVQAASAAGTPPAVRSACRRHPPARTGPRPWGGGTGRPAQLFVDNENKNEKVSQNGFQLFALALDKRVQVSPRPPVRAFRKKKGPPESVSDSAESTLLTSLRDAPPAAHSRCFPLVDATPGPQSPSAARLNVNEAPVWQRCEVACAAEWMPESEGASIACPQSRE